MKEVKQPSVGFNITIKNVPESAEEFDRMAGKEGACVDAANNQVTMHNYLGKFRKSLAEELEKVTGIERFKETVDDKVRYTETENKYFGRIEAQLAEQGIAFHNEYATTAQEVADKIDYDVTPGRTPGVGSKPAKKYLDYYTKLKTEDKLGVFAEKHELDLEIDEDGNIADTDTNVIMVCNKIKSILDAAAAKAAQEAMAI